MSEAAARPVSGLGVAAEAPTAADAVPAKKEDGGGKWGDGECVDGEAEAKRKLRVW